MWPFTRSKPKIETRSAMQGFTAELLAARESYLSGARGVGELTASVQSCVTLWENGLSLAEVSGTDLLTPAILAMIARSLALRGEAVFLIRGDVLAPASDWELSTRYGLASAYRVTIPDAGGGSSQTALASEVLHFRIGADVSSPWSGTAPLRRAPLTASLLHAIESALAEVYEFAPLGSQVLPFPESPETDLQKLGNQFRGKRGRVLLRESVNVTAAGGPAPNGDWSPENMTPDLSRAMTGESLEAARGAILGAFGVLPALFSQSVQGPVVREAQRHLAQWQLQPIARGLAAEASDKLGADVWIDTLKPLQAYDAGGRARAIAALVEAMAAAKQAGIDFDKVAKLVDWEE